MVATSHHSGNDGEQAATIEFLASPDAYGGRIDTVKRIDTHAAIVEASGVMVGTSCGIDHAYVPREAVTPRPTTHP